MNSTKNASPGQARKKTQPEEFDLVILGGGTGSTIAAWTFAGEGKQVAVVERKYIGGARPKIPCFPRKNNIHNAQKGPHFSPNKEFGLTHNGFPIHIAGVGRRQRRNGAGLEH